MARRSMKRALFATLLRCSLGCKVKPGSKLLTRQTRTQLQTGIQLQTRTQLQAGAQLQTGTEAGAQIWLQLQLQSEMLVQVFVYNLCTSWPGVIHVCEVS